MIDRSEIPIFIVDDDEELLTMVWNVLTHAGFKKLHKSRNANEALMALTLPDTDGSKTAVMRESGIAILDVVLPDIDGFELCKQIKERIPDNMVLMMSGFNIEDLNAKLIDSEADDFLTKPFGSPELVARIEMLAARMVKRSSRFASADPHERLIPAGNRIPHIGDYIDEYMILDSLGWGKNSVIYKVVKKGGNEIFAIKLLTKYSMEFKDVVKRFEQERRVMAQLDHPNIIKFYKTGTWDGCPYIVMECIRGINLEERLVTDGVPNTILALTAAHQIASGINAMHKLGIIHRDIKLKNIMFEPETASFKLTDFGIARFMEDAQGITCDGFIVGTPIYMAPEVFRGEKATIESDIYSYGVTMYHFISGSPPFSAKKNSEMYKKHLEEAPPPISTHNTAMSKELDDIIIGRCMAKLPEDRPHSLDEVLEALDRLGAPSEGA